MKKTDLKEKSSVYIVGKGFIITAIFITSALSFTLGYFVGKIGNPRAENQTLPISQQERIEQKNIVYENKEAVAQKPEQLQKIQQVAETQQTQEAQRTQETKKTQETKDTVKNQEKPKSLQKIKYTVQVGAFKDASDADALKTKLDKKGYKAYITQSESKKNKNLYKVRIGEFNTKKEAELLSIKIRKTEGLQTFATFKTEQEDIR